LGSPWSSTIARAAAPPSAVANAEADGYTLLFASTTSL
jgi:hypothetical protein